MPNGWTKKWTDEHQAVVDKAVENLVNKGIPFTIQSICTDTGFAKTTIQGRVNKTAAKMDVALAGVLSKDWTKKITVKAHKDRKDDYVSKPKKKDTGKQKFMCKCLTDVGIMWMSMSAHDKESAEKYIKEDYDIQGILGVYTMREYSQVRLPSQRMSSKQSLTEANSIGNRAGRGGRKG